MIRCYCSVRRWGVISSIWLVYAFLTRWCPHLLYLADLAGDGEGEEKCFTFTLYLGSHTHIFKTRIFNQNSTLKSIKSLDGLEREKTLIDSCGLWGIPVATVYRCIWKWWPTESSLVLGSMGLFLFGFAKSIDLWLLPPRIDFGIQPQWTALGSLCRVLMWVFPQSLVLPGVVSLGTDGEGWGRKFTFVLYLGSHTHIFKTLPSNSLSCLTGQRKRRFWLSPVNCGGFPLRLFVAAFGSDAHQIHLLSWVSLGLIPSRINFGIQLRWTALDFLCWVLMWVLPQSLVSPRVVILGTDGTHVFPILLLWLARWLINRLSLTFAFKKFSYFSECTECHWQKALACKELWRHSRWHWLGTHTALSAGTTYLWNWNWCFGVKPYPNGES